MATPKRVFANADHRGSYAASDHQPIASGRATEPGTLCAETQRGAQEPRNPQTSGSVIWVAVKELDVKLPFYGCII